MFVCPECACEATVPWLTYANVYPAARTQGVALVHFEDATGANTALAGLNGLKIVNNVLIAQRAPAGMLNAGSAKAAEEAKPQPVLILSNMTTPDMVREGCASCLAILLLLLLY